MQTTASSMRLRGQVIIINMCGGDRIPGGTGYSCSKVAVVRFTELLAQELQREGLPIMAFVMGPGFVRTPMTERQATTPEGRKWLPSSKDAFDQGRDRPPDDCAHAAVRLIAIAHPGISGQTFGPDTNFDELAAGDTQSPCTPVQPETGRIPGSCYNGYSI